MRPAAWLGWVCLLACGAQEAPVPVPRQATPRAEPGATLVVRRGDRYDLHAHGDTPFEALAELAVVAGFRAERGEGPIPEAPIHVEQSGVGAQAAIAALLRGIPYHVHYEWDGPAPERGPWLEGPTRLAAVTVGGLPSTPRRAARVLGPGGERPTPGFVGVAPPPLPRGAEGRRSESALQLALRLDPEAHDAILTRALEDTDPSVRVEALGHLEPVGEELEVLTRLLATDPEPAVRAAAAEALSDGHGYATAPRLLDALDDPDARVVTAAIGALEDAFEDHPMPEVRGRVAELLEHPDGAVREAAGEFLEWVEE